jgi:hypothetical protein
LEARLGEVGALTNLSMTTSKLTLTGTEYSNEDVFDLSRMKPYNLEKLYNSFSTISKHVVLYLPRTSDLNQIAKYAPEDKKAEVAHYCMMGASKVFPLNPK